ncbi:MAG: hypothetical protein MK116_06035 [Phycisphaerales bacterium]|nr:hypothetical protein [Phycisphaerales bacterium]
MSRSLSALGLLLLSSWLAVVCAAGLSAGVTFSTFPAQEPSVPGYEALDVETRSRLVAGLVTEPVFSIADMAQLILCPLVIIVLFLQARVGDLVRRRATHVIRVAAVAIATIVFFARWLFVNPPLNADLSAYRAAARDGDVVTALEILAGFEKWHHLAEGLWAAAAISLLIAIAATGAALPRGDGSR